MHAGDSLHLPTVTIAKAASIDGLHLSDIRRPVTRQRNLDITWNAAGHAGYPQQLIVESFISELMHVTYRAKRLPCAGVCGRYEFQQGFREVRCDKAAGQG